MFECAVKYLAFAFTPGPSIGMAAILSWQNHSKNADLESSFHLLYFWYIFFDMGLIRQRAFTCTGTTFIYCQEYETSVISMSILRTLLIS